MKIAFLADGGHPNCFRWAEYYAGLGATVAVFDFRRERSEGAGVDYFPISAPVRSSKIRYLISAGAARRALEVWRPDVVIGYRLVSYGFLAARTGVRPLVLAAQGQNLIPPGAPPFAKRMVAWSLRRADLIHAWSPGMAERMVALGAAPAKIVVRPRGILLDRWKDAGSRASRPTLLSTRQLEPYYNQRLLVEALARIRESLPEVELVLAGTGSDLGHLTARVRALGLEKNVRFAGVLDQGALITELQQAWLYVSAVPTDGVSSSLLEAMACGCYPIVVDNRPNRTWLRSAAQGALFGAGDEGAFAREALRVLASEGARDEARKVNRGVVEREADLDGNMRGFLDAYRELLRHAEAHSASGSREARSGALPG